MLPHTGVELVRVERVEFDIGPAGFWVHVQNFFPVLTAICGLVDSTVFVFPPQRAQGRGIDDFRIGRMQGDPVDALGPFQPTSLPCFTAVDGLEHAAADRCGVAHIALAGTDPDDVRIVLVDGNRSNRGDRLIIEYRSPGQSAVRRDPDPTRGCSNHDMVGIGGNGVDGGNPSADCGWPQRACRQTLQQVGIQFSCGRRR